MKPIIVLGDITSHGGVVLEGDSVTLVNGKAVASVGDQVSCPTIGHGLYFIVTGDQSTIANGKAIARHRDLCSCGATLIDSVADTGVS